jgi:hypothetical protein
MFWSPSSTGVHPILPGLELAEVSPVAATELSLATSDD